MTLIKTDSGSVILKDFYISKNLYEDLEKIRADIRQHSIDTGNEDVAKGYDFETFLENALYVYRADMFRKGIGK